MSTFRKRPGETKEGRVGKNEGGPETTEFKDGTLFDFDIDDDTPKSAHLEYLREVVRYMDRNLRIGSGRAFVVHLAGFASRTGAARHNELLSAMREQAAEAQLRTALDLRPSLKPFVTFNRKFHGFEQSPPGENARFRAVRVVVTRSPLPPPPITADPTGSTSWKIRQIAAVGLGVPIGVPGLSGALDEVFFEIVDTAPGGQIGLFEYRGKGLQLGIPKVPLPPVSGGAVGEFTVFFTTNRVDLRDFEGKASFGQPPAAGPFGSSLLAIQSRAFFLTETRTKPDPIPISGFTVGVTIFSSSLGDLTLKQVNGRSVNERRRR